MSSDGVLEKLIEHFRNGQRHALARLITLLSQGRHVEAIRAALDSNSFGQHEPGAANSVIALTGSGGVGKSTLIGRLVEHLRGKGTQTAVLACDPQSPLTGGALLGDRIRMPSRPDDDGVFIRSLAVPAGNQAVAAHVDLMIRLLQLFGFDVVLLETVGAGQGDTAVSGLADVVVLLVQPEAGDELQWEKAGVLEVADVVAVNKSDLPGAERVEAQLREMLNLPGCRVVPVIRTSGGKNDGVESLWDAIESSAHAEVVED